MREFTASVTERGQVTIPAEVRRLLGLKKRDKLSFVVEDGKVTVRKPRFTIETLAGSVPALKEPIEWDEMMRIVHEEIAEREIRKLRGE